MFIKGVTFAAALVATMAALVPSSSAAERAEIIHGSGKQIVSIKADGSSREVLAEGTSPRISPNGEKLLFLGRAGRGSALLTANRDGSQPTQIFRNKPRRYMGKFRIGGLAAAEWGPGQRVYLLISGSWGKKKPRQYAERIISMRPDGSDRRTIMNRVVGLNASYEPTGHFDVSPDGKRILLVENSFRGYQSPLRIHDLKTGKSRKIFGQASGGRWSPDGRQIVFESNFKRQFGWCDDGEVCHYDSKVYVIRPDGSGLRRVTPLAIPGSESGADWSPDGSRIVYSSDRNNRLDGGSGYIDFHNPELFSIRVDGKCLNWLTNGSDWVYGPDWGPEKGRDFAPASCSDRARVPLSRNKPKPWTDGKGNPLGIPRLWLGPVFNSLMPDYDRYFSGGGELEYRDCALFVRSDCGPGINVVTQRQCEDRRSDSDVSMVKDGEFGSLERRRGAIVMRSRDLNQDGVPGILLLTGRQTVSAGPYWLYPAELVESDYLEMIDALRPVGAPDASAPLEEALLDRVTVERAANINEYFEQTGSVASTAEQFKITANETRSFLRFHDEVERIGPVKTIQCLTGEGN